MKSMRLKIQNSYGNLKKVIRPKFQSLAFLLVKYIYFFHSYIGNVNDTLELSMQCKQRQVTSYGQFI